MAERRAGKPPGCNRKWAFFSIFGVLAAVAIAPILLADYPGLPNYPNLLARVFIIANLPGSDALSQYYQFHSKLVPNLALDLIGPLIVDLGMRVEQVGKIFVALSILAFCGGTVFLAYAAQRRPPWLALAIFAFAINGYSGLLNYIFGLGLALAALALWLLTKRETVWTAVLFSLVPCLLLLCHLLAFGVYALAIASFAAYGWFASPKQRVDCWKLVRESLCFLPAVLIYMFFFEHRGTLGFYYENPLETKLAGIFAAFSAPDGLSWDFPLIALMVAAAMFLWWRAGIAFSSRETAVASAAMLAAFLVAPVSALGFWFVDGRLALPLLCFTLAFGHVQRRSDLTPNILTALALVLLAVVLQRSAATVQQWQFASETYTQVRHAMDSIEIGSRIATILREPGSGLEFTPEQTVASFAIMDHSAFVPDFDGFPLSQDSIAFKDEVVDDARHFRNLVIKRDTASSIFDWTRLGEKFDYVLFFLAERDVEAPVAFRRVAEGKGFVLFSTPRRNAAAPSRASNNLLRPLSGTA